MMCRKVFKGCMSAGHKGEAAKELPHYYTALKLPEA